MSNVRMNERKRGDKLYRRTSMVEKTKCCKSSTMAKRMPIWFALAFVPQG